VGEIIVKLRRCVGKRALYISIDIDVLEPTHAPSTDTLEASGLTSRELPEIIRSLRSLNIVGADVVEVARACVHAKITDIAASHVAYGHITLMAHLRCPLPLLWFCPPDPARCFGARAPLP
jgi:agmatinase